MLCACCAACWRITRCGALATPASSLLPPDPSMQSIHVQVFHKWRAGDLSSSAASTLTAWSVVGTVFAVQLHRRSYPSSSAVAVGDDVSMSWRRRSQFFCATAQRRRARSFPAGGGRAGGEAGGPMAMMFVFAQSKAPGPYLPIFLLHAQMSVMVMVMVMLYIFCIFYKCHLCAPYLVHAESCSSFIFFLYIFCTSLLLPRSAAAVSCCTRCCA